MREAKSLDILLLVVLAAIWGSSFFNIKIECLKIRAYQILRPASRNSRFPSCPSIGDGVVPR